MSKTTERDSANTKRFAKAATDVARELIRDECTGIDHYIQFDNGDVWVVNLFKMPASAIQSIVVHHLGSKPGPEGGVKP